MSKLMKQSGVTLYEILITLVIVGVLAAIAVPSFQYVMQNTRAVTLSNSFTSALALARSEAVKRGNPVTLCASANAAQTTCGNNGNWPNGWIIFNDPNGDGVIAAATDRIKVQEALEPGTTFTSAQSRVTYASTGFASAGAGTFDISAPGCSGDNGRSITISTTGRVSIAQVAC